MDSIKIFIATAIVLCCTSIVSAEDNRLDTFNSLEELRDFIVKDSTDSHEYIFIKYMCGDFSTDLVINSSKHNKYMGYVLTSPDKNFISTKNHILCYTYIYGKKVYVEPQTDRIMNTSVMLSKYKYIIHVEQGNVNPINNFINIFKANIKDI